MRSIQPAYRRRSSFRMLVGTPLIAIVAGSGLLLVLHLLGVNINPFAGPREDPFMVRIPINSKPIPAYEQVDRLHMLNPATGGLMYQRVPPQATIGMSLVGIGADGSRVTGRVEAVRNVNNTVVFVVANGTEVSQSQTLELGGALIDVNAIIGRVVKRDKRAGLGFSEDNFFQQGTPEGIAGATPSGMRAVTLDASKLTGVYGLHAGDRIDLMASVPLDQVTTFNSQYSSRLPGAALVTSRASDKTSKNVATQPILLVQNALVLKPVSMRNETTMSSSLTQGKRVQNVPKHEVAFAVAPDDVIPLQTALNKQLEITCIAHSMQVTANDAVPTSNDPQKALAPVTVRGVLAYDVVTRDAFVNPATREIRLERVSPEQIERLGIVTSLEDAIGAVARHDIPSGSFVTRNDLLSGSVEPAGKKSASQNRNVHGEHGPKTAPASFQLVNHSVGRNPEAVDEHPKRTAAHGRSTDIHLVAMQQPANEPITPNVVGDRPAITSFVPPGRTAFAIPWNRMYGAEHLQIGDRMDLLASFSLDSEDEQEETETRPDGTKIVRKRTDIATRKTLRTWDESFGWRGEPWFVTSDAVVVGPVGFPAPAAAQRALANENEGAPANSTGNNLSGPPLIIAVDDRDVESVAAVLATKKALFTLAFHRSGNDELAAPNGMRRIAIAVQDIAPFEALTESVWQGNRRRPVSLLVRIDDSRFAGALDVEEITQYYNRVLKQAKRRFDSFMADDFLAPGIQPGIAASVRPGHTIYATADQEIEGLDTCQNGDQIAILIRGVTRRLPGVIAHGIDLQRPVSYVVVREARVLRASRAGQTILEIRNEDLTRLQAAWASSFSERENSQDTKTRRSHLLAVALPRGNTPAVPANLEARVPPSNATDIPDFDAIGNAHFTEAIVGSKRQVHVFPARSDSTDGPHSQNLFNLADD